MMDTEPQQSNCYNNVVWPYLLDEQNRFWVLCYAEEGKYKVVITDAARVVQEPYVEDCKHEDMLTVFTDTNVATLFIASLGKKIGSVHNDHFRVVSMSADRLMSFLDDLDSVYENRQNAYLRVDICELVNGDLRRELLFSRQVPKN
jgi:hypothetical protein